MSFSELLWKMSQDFVHLTEMNADQLVEYYLFADYVRDLSEDEDCTACEKIAAQNLFDNIKKEVDRRGLKIIPLFVHMDKEGNFVRGRDELKSFWKSLPFDEMVKDADMTMEQCQTEAQRMALIELEREIVYETAEAG